MRIEYELIYVNKYFSYLLPSSIEQNIHLVVLRLLKFVNQKYMNYCTDL